MESRTAIGDSESPLILADPKQDLPQNVEKEDTSNHHSHFDSNEMEEFGLGQPKQSDDITFKKPAFCDLVEEEKHKESEKIVFGNEIKLRHSVLEICENKMPR